MSLKRDPFIWDGSGGQGLNHRPWIAVALVAQLVEHILGKDEVTGSIPVKGFCALEAKGAFGPLNNPYLCLTF